MRTNKVIVIYAVVFFLAFSIAMEAVASEHGLIHFYGKVVDQFNNSVADATINLGIKQNQLESACKFLSNFVNEFTFTNFEKINLRVHHNARSNIKNIFFLSAISASSAFQKICEIRD